MRSSSSYLCQTFVDPGRDDLLHIRPPELPRPGLLHEVVLEVLEDPEDEGFDLVIENPAAGPGRRGDELVEVVLLAVISTCAIVNMLQGHRRAMTLTLLECHEESS